MRRLPIDLAGLALAPLLLAGACSTPPDRETQIHVIQADVEETFGGDTGALIYHGYEAARLAEAADTARAELASQPSWSPADINISDRATEMADQAAEQKRQAEAALDRILDPLRDRIAKLEEAQAKGQPTAALPGPAAVTAVLHFAPGSAAIPAPRSSSPAGPMRPARARRAPDRPAAPSPGPGPMRPTTRLAPAGCRRRRPSPSSPPRRRATTLRGSARRSRCGRKNRNGPQPAHRRRSSLRVSVDSLR